MRDISLVSITSRENKTYIDRFNKIISDKSSYLSNKHLMTLEFYTRKPVIGQVLESCFGCSKVLRLKKFEKVKETDELADKYSTRRVKKAWLVTSDIAKGYGLSIGSNGNGVEIFREVCNNESYFLSGQLSDKRTEWIEPPPEFMKETHSLLPMDVQLVFKELVEAQITK